VVDNGRVGGNMSRIAGAITGLALDVGVVAVEVWARIAVDGAD
jgi:hypothetical protein